MRRDKGRERRRGRERGLIRKGAADLRRDIRSCSLTVGMQADGRLRARGGMKE